jgi:hypothetical protein
MADSDTQLMGELRSLWERTDPMPATLPDQIIAAIAADDLDFELLTLTAAEAVAVRGGEAQVLECSTDDLTLVVRISESSDGTRRLDGWSEGVHRVELLTDEGSRTATVTEAGRFEFDDVPTGAVRLRLHGEDKGFETPEIEV